MLTPHRYSGRAEWLRARRIGSSDVPALLGLSRYAGPVELYERLALGVIDDSPRTPEQLRGILLEPQILATYAARTGYDVRATPPHTLYMRDAWATTTPDALREEHGEIIDVEVKSDRDPSRWGAEQPIDEWGSGAEKVVRPDYYLQAQHQLWTLDVHRADLVVLMPSDDPLLPELRVYPIRRDERVVEALVDRCLDFWRRHVVAGEPPPLDDGPASTRLLAAVGRSGSRRATAHEQRLADGYVEAALAERAWKDRKRAIGRELVASAGQSRYLDLPVGRVAIVAGQSASQLDERALLDDHPELEPVLESYRRPGGAFVYPRVGGATR